MKDELNIGIIDNQNNEKTNGSKYFNNQKRESVVSNNESEPK